jgi:hypothetical protein
MNESLIILDTDKVKDYVFATGNLKEIRGASSLLERLNTDETKKHLRSVITEDKVIYCGGGSAMAIVPTDQAEMIIQTIQRLYHQETTTASISGAALRLPENYETQFGELASLAGQKLRQVKDETAPVLQIPLMPWFRDCDSCGHYPAESYDALNFLCKSCSQKRKASQQATTNDKQKISQRSIFWQQFRDHVNRETVWTASQLPEGFTEIGQVATPSDYIGFIYADGNGMGEILKQLQTPQKYGNFSQRVDKWTREVTCETLNHYASSPRQVGQTKVAPFEILLVGGDDLMIVTAADLALPVAIKLAQDFEDRSEAKTGEKLSLSVGVVLAHASYPIAAMSELAEALLKSAKKESSKPQVSAGSKSNLVSALDFMVVTAASSRELEWVRDETLTDKGFVYPVADDRKCRLTHRPYPVDDLAKLYDFALKFRQENFPSSQLQALYDNLFVSFNTASFSAITALARLSKKHRQLFEEFIEAFQLNQPPPWRQLEGTPNYSTALGDLIEMYRFVSVPRSNHANRHD